MVIHSATPPDFGASPTKEEWVAKNGSAERSSVIRVSGAHLALFEARGFQSQIGPTRQEFNKLLTWGATREKRRKNACYLFLDDRIWSVDGIGFDPSNAWRGAR